LNFIGLDFVTSESSSSQKDFVMAALQLFSRFNCKELLLVKYTNANI